MAPTYPIIWRHPSGRIITVYADCKVRTGYYWNYDAWGTLNRSVVPALTDDEWIATPGPEWTKE